MKKSTLKTALLALEWRLGDLQDGLQSSEGWYRHNPIGTTVTGLTAPAPPDKWHRMIAKYRRAIEDIERELKEAQS